MSQRRGEYAAATAITRASCKSLVGHHRHRCELALSEPLLGFMIRYQVDIGTTECPPPHSAAPDHATRQPVVLRSIRIGVSQRTPRFLRNNVGHPATWPHRPGRRRRVDSANLRPEAGPAEMRIPQGPAARGHRGGRYNRNSHTRFTHIWVGHNHSNTTPGALSLANDRPRPVCLDGAFSTALRTRVGSGGRTLAVSE
jgi:hypothetical protein